MIGCLKYIQEIKRELLAEDYVTYESKNKYEGEVYEFKPDIH